MSSHHPLTVQQLNNFLHDMDQRSPFMDVASSFSSQDKVFQQPFDVNYLASMVGDVLPAAAAVLGESPTMDTPYLDSSMTPYTPYASYTPYTPATTFTPIVGFASSMEAMQGSPHFSPCMESNDIQITAYLANSNWLAVSSSSSLTPVVDIPAFNGDPSQLFLDKVKGAATCNSSHIQSISPSAHLGWQDEPSAESSDNMLFPPLVDDEIGLDYPTDATSAFDSDIFNAFSNFDFGDETTQQQQQKQVMHSVLSSNDGNNDQHQSHQTNDSSGPSSNNKKRRSTLNEPGVKRRRKSNNTNNANGDKKYECKICNATFNRRYNLGTHSKTHNKDRVKDYTCNICAKGFDRRHDRDRHISTVHNGERAFACNTCLASFSRKDALTRHCDQQHGIV